MTQLDRSDDAPPPHGDAGAVDVIESDALKGLSGVRHAFFTRRGGVSGGLYGSLNIGFGSDDERAAVVENRRRCATHLGVLPGALTTLYQVHSATAVTVDNPWAPGDAPRADGIATDRPGVALGIATADCAPVLFADATASVVGACHAGWKGAIGGVVDATIAAMEQLGADRANITATVGPCIAQPSYEVGVDFRETFVAQSPDYEAYFTQGVAADKAQFDLPGFVVDRVRASGVSLVDWTGDDTRADPDRFFSYRRTTLAGEADYGRLLSAIVLQDHGA